MSLNGPASVRRRRLWILVLLKLSDWTHSGDEPGATDRRRCLSMVCCSSCISSRGSGAPLPIESSNCGYCSWRSSTSSTAITDGLFANFVASLKTRDPILTGRNRFWVARVIFAMSKRGGSIGANLQDGRIEGRVSKL